MGQTSEQPDFVAEVYSPQLAQKVRSKMVPGPASGSPSGEGGAREVRRRAARQNTDTWLAWNALPNEYIAAIGAGPSEPVLGGSVSKLFSRGVLRFPSSVQRIEFRTDNISSENQGVLVEGWACWRVVEAKKALQQLDFSDSDDPMSKTSTILGIQCAGIMKGLISVKSVAELLKRREDLIDALRKKLKPTEERWGLSFDEIGISEVQVLSQEVFENMQRPFRNEAREVASTSDLETEERVARKRSEQHERVAKIESDGERAQRELVARSQTQIRGVEIEEERKRLEAAKDVASIKMEEEKRLKSLAADLERRLKMEAVQAEMESRLRQISAKEQETLRQLQAEEAREGEALRLKALRDAAAVEAERAQVAQRLELEKSRIAAELETTRATEEVAAARRIAASDARRSEATLEAECNRVQMAVNAEREAARLQVAEQDRAIGGRYSDAEIRMQLVERLPLIAGNIKVGDVRWYGGTADGGPLGIIGKAVEEVLDVASAHGIDLGRRPTPKPAPSS